MNNWEKLCEHLTPLIKKNVLEDLFHESFESALKTIFDWDNGNIHHNMPVPMGCDIKFADIVLTGNNYGIVIEMKKPDAILGDKEVGQLTSYMRILGHKFGFLIGSEFRVFYDNDTSSNLPIQIASFGFDPNNPDGISLGDILDKNNCSHKKLKEYAVMHIERIQTQQKMAQLKTELLNNNGEKIRSIIKNKLISDGYNNECITDILENIVITYKSTNNQQITNTAPLRDTNIPKGKDNTQYRFLDTEDGKRKLVLKIIKDYIQNHDNCTLESLRATFPKRLQGSFDVVDTFENANEIYTRTKCERHFLRDIITLSSGQRIVVCNEWGIKNINRFIDKAREIGYQIEEI